jgi:hypothetical protein
MYRYTTLRPAIAMIELIFALVVMGIVLTSAPLLVSQASKSNTVALQQESIAIAAAHTNTLMTYAWDEQNNRPNAITAIIDTTAGDPLLARSTAPLYRNNSLAFPLARLRRFSNTILLASPLGIDSNASASSVSDDVDDFIVQVVELIPQSTTQNKAYEGEYIDTKIKLTTAVSYGIDTAPNYDNVSGRFAFSNPFTSLATGTSNIKLITTQLTTTETTEELQKNIKMQAFMCNIGGAQPISKGGY